MLMKEWVRTIGHKRTVHALFLRFAKYVVLNTVAFNCEGPVLPDEVASLFNLLNFSNALLPSDTWDFDQKHECFYTYNPVNLRKIFIGSNGVCTAASAIVALLVNLDPHYMCNVHQHVTVGPGVCNLKLSLRRSLVDWRCFPHELYRDWNSDYHYPQEVHVDWISNPVAILNPDPASRNAKDEECRLQLYKENREAFLALTLQDFVHA